VAQKSKSLPNFQKKTH